jgi:GT2 family glycosyltransferase
LVRVSVIIPTLNRKTLLVNCLHSLMRQTYRDFEVLVVDSGCTDGTERLVSQFPVNWLERNGRSTEKSPATVSENRGTEAAHGDIIAFLDDDEVAADDWLERLIGSYERIRADGVGGRIIDPRKNLEISSVGRQRFRLFKKAFSIVGENKLTVTGLILRSGEPTSNFDRSATACLDVHHLPGGNMSFRRQVFETIGLFDESYAQTSFRYETDFCIRARANGFRLIYNPAAVVWHQRSIHTSRPLGRALGPTLFYNTVNDVAFVLRHRRQIEGFSWTRLVLRQTLLFINYIRFAVLRKNLAYLSGPKGMLWAIRNWMQDKDGIRRGRVPTGQRLAGER